MDHPGNRGILNKMEYQWAAFSELAGHVDLICSSNRGPVLNGKLAGKYPIRGRGFDSLNHYALFYSYVTRYATIGDYDFLYIRYPLALPSFLGFLRKARRANPDVKIVLEVATFPYRRELQSPKQRILRMFDDLGHGQLKNHADAMVTFYGQAEIFGVPCFQLGNGVDVQRIRLHTAGRCHDQLSMIAVGNLAERHGLDRVLRGIARYANQPGAKNTTLHVVGDGPAMAELTALTTQLGIDDHVRFHGIKRGLELDAVFDEADIALDSLAIHRLHLPCSSSLKAREYCARGIPFVLAGDDPDFPAELPFVHRVPSNDAPLDLSTLVNFYAHLRQTTPTINQEMRCYAEKHLTWKAKLEPVVHYLQED
jgi:glycosyltransferase involved in cell wall biosynthesis